MKTILAVVFGIIAINSYSQELPNKFTNPRIKDSVSKRENINAITAGIINQNSYQSAITSLNFGSAAYNHQLDSNIKIIYSNETKLPIYIESNQVRQTIKSQSIDSAIKIRTTAIVNNDAINYLNELQPVTKMIIGSRDLEIIDTKIDENGKSHIKFQQKYKGINVFGNQFIVHLNNKGQGELFNGNYQNITEDIDINPTITKETAIGIAKLDLSKKSKFFDFKEVDLKLIGGANIIVDTLIYFNDSTLKNQLVYRITIFPNIIERWEYFISTTDGTIISSYNTTCTIDVPKTSSSVDLKGVSRVINTVLNGSNYLLKDITRPMYSSASASGYIETYDGNLESYASNIKNEISNSNNVWTPTQVSAQYNSGAVYDFYKNVHNRNSINGNGGNIYSIINVNDTSGLPLENAFFNKTSMFYGNGGVVFKPLAAALDVAGHEMTHGVVYNSAGLINYGQSGALDESFADIFGAMVDSTNWTIGEDVVNKNYFPTGALRSLSDPHNGGKSKNDNGWQPKYMYEYVNGKADNGGVHANSGIPNYAFYLFANAIGRLKASRIYYYALTHYFTRSSNFTQLRLYVIKSASDLYSNTEAIQAGLAFDAVGISDGTIISITKKLLPNPGTESLMLYGSNITDTTVYITSQALKPLWSKKINNRPSITDDGKTAYVVGYDKKIYSFTCDPSSTQQTYYVLQNQAVWNNVSISKDGKRLAATTIYQDSLIYIYDFGKKNWFKFKLYNPTNTEGVKTAGPVYADSFEWDYSSENIIYDCLNKMSKSNLATDSYWDINMINVWNKASDTTTNGNITKLFKLSDYDNVGNPVFSKNSPDVIAFDYFNDSTKLYGVFGYNLQTNKIGLIYSNNTIGYPTYNKNDDKLAIRSIINNKLSVGTVLLNADKISSTNSIISLFNNVTFPLFYTTGIRKFEVPSTPNITTNSSPNLCTGDSVILISSATTGNQWFKNGSAIINANNQKYVSNITGNYTVLSNIDSISSSLSDGVYVTMNPIPNTPIIGRDTSGFLNSTNQYGNIWYKDGVITTDTAKKIKPTLNGLYTAKTVLNGCSSTLSNSYYFLVTDIVNLSSTEYIKINPNPFYNNLIFEFKVNGHQQLNIDVFSLSTGQKITTKSNQYSGSLLNFGQLSSGVYVFIVYSSDNKIKTQFKMVKL